MRRVLWSSAVAVACVLLLAQATAWGSVYGNCCIKELWVDDFTDGFDHAGKDGPCWVEVRDRQLIWQPQFDQCQVPHSPCPTCGQIDIYKACPQFQEYCNIELHKNPSCGEASRHSGTCGYCHGCCSPDPTEHTD